MSDTEQARFEQLKDDVQEYDEIHAHVAELGEKDIRQKDVEFNDDACLVTIDDGVTFHRIPMEHVVHWYPPREF